MSLSHSVHLENFPDTQPIKEEAALVAGMDQVRSVCNTALAVRNEANIRIRQPLNKLQIIGKRAADLEPYLSIIEEELNVKSVEISSHVEEYADLNLSINFPVLGKRLPTKMKEIIAASKQGKWSKKEDQSIEVAGEILSNEECSLTLIPRAKQGAQALPSNDALVILDLELDENLLLEGLARDLVRCIQQARKEADLHISDTIDLNITTQSDRLKESVKRFTDSKQFSISANTLAASVTFNESFTPSFQSKALVDGEEVTIAFRISA